MVFSSFLFLFIFLPLVVVINRYLPLKLSNLFIFIVSLFFYYVGEGILVCLLTGSILWNYIFGLTISGATNNALTKTYLLIGVFGNLALLLYYKYFGFLVESTFLKKWIATSAYSDIILPIGISFFTFQGLSYLVDVYRKVVPATADPIKLGLFISFFPQLVAGPIVKYKELASYLSDRNITTPGMVTGSQKFIRGLAKKVLIADNLAILSDAIFISEYSSLPTVLAWLGILCYTLQIYYDFSGYSDMAIGLCLVMGFKIPENFNHPYIAQSVRDFWRRWHISLSTWFRDYLYFPLGGNRKGSGRTYLNLLIVFLLTGLWHGANFNFILWGLIHGGFMILERKFPAMLASMPRIIRHLYLLIVVSFTWVLFRTTSLSAASAYLLALASFDNSGDWLPLLQFNYLSIFIISVAIILIFPTRLKITELLSFNTKTNPLVHHAAYLGLAMLCIMEITVSDYSPFIYFKF